MSTTPVRSVPLLLVAAVLVACSGSGSSGGATTPPPGGGGGPAAFTGTIKVLSNRSDLVSGGDALVEVVLPAGTTASDVIVKLNSTDVTSQFGARSTASDRYLGLVTGMTTGDNVLTAQTASTSPASVTIHNAPAGGPVFEGPQLSPWTCQGGALDAACNQAPTYEYRYKSTDSTITELQPYDPNNPPSDVATAQPENGPALPFIVRVETGYIDRDQYKIAVLFQPGQDWQPWAPQAQFNHKLVITHGASCGVDYDTGGAPSVTKYYPPDYVYSGTPAPPGAVGDATQYALGAGFAVMSHALDNSGHNCNIALQAEALMMTKEYLIERYGELRYTIGQGCSGGSLAAQWIANAYPGIYQGIIPTCSFPDAWSTASQFLDYHLLLAYFQDPSQWTVPWTNDQMARVEGHVTIANANVSEQAQWHVAVPTDSCSGIAAPQAGDSSTRYDPTTNPGGVRCSIQEAAINIFAPRDRYAPGDSAHAHDLWSANEVALGRGFGGVPIDNVGVQYGLSVLQQGLITPAQFLEVNQKAGGVDIDTNPTAARIDASTPALANAYRSGMINETNNLNYTAIIDCRGPDPGAFHDSYRAFAIRERLNREHGNHDNQAIWEGPVIIIGDGQCLLNAFKEMDGWLTAVENDHAAATVAQKLVNDKPATVTDRCYDGNGVKTADTLCPGTGSDPSNAYSNPTVPVYGTPRWVAGDALSTDTNKCQLKALPSAAPTPPADMSYGPAPFTAGQWTALQAVFPDGVCDFSKPGVSQQGTVPWMTYLSIAGTVIYGGAPMAAPPANSGEGWASAAFAP